MRKSTKARASDSARSAERRVVRDIKAAAPWGNPDGPAHVYIGPSLDGEDKEYVKVISGRVTDRKPSFA
ncbi:hypothetical protein [Gorillibacterium sp. CAU 1737]|uniref:hypothetical protein n=1 Tax=Gorillibacterium sp. CAU 1737 TaxID=3140362 RepID=UPI00326142E5